MFPGEAVQHFGLVDDVVIDRLEVAGTAKRYAVESVAVGNVGGDIAAVDHLLDLALQRP